MPATAALPRGLVWVIAAMLFFLAATNGRPMWWNSAVPSLFFATVLLLWRGPGEIIDAALAPRNEIFSILLFLLLIATALSTLANADFITIQSVVLRCGIPFMVYVSLVGVTLARKDVIFLVAAVAAGAFIPLTTGTFAFFTEWGIPDLDTFLWARFNEERMMSYTQATFGSVGHMAEYTLLLVPAFVIAAISPAAKGALRPLLLAAAALGLVNLGITGSRSAFMIVFLALVLIFLKPTAGRNRMIVLLVFGLATYLVLSSLSELALRESLIDRFFPTAGSRQRDPSIEARYESLLLGWQDFVENPFFGIGPGASFMHTIHGVPHQSIVYMLSEIGLFGGLVFGLLSIFTMFRAYRSAVHASRDPREETQFLWLIGPACWLANGMLGGMTFNIGLSLALVGTAYAMIALAGATVVASPNLR